MKLATSTGDFRWYYENLAEHIKAFKDTKFKYINLELERAIIPELLDETDAELERLSEKLSSAAEYAGITYVVAHAPCLHTPCLGVLENPDDETYHHDLRVFEASLKVCRNLKIPRIVIHACPHSSFSEADFYSYNKKFYSDILPTAEKFGVTVMTENWDNDETHFSTGKQLRDFIDFIGHPLLGACWDTAHGNIAKTSKKLGQYKNIIDIGDKLKGLHISDNFGDCHHHTFPFAGIINFDSIMQGLCDVNYDGFFTFEASYTLLHQNNMPYRRSEWEHNGNTVTRLLNPSPELKKSAVNLLFETGKYILETYNVFDE